MRTPIASVFIGFLLLAKFAGAQQLPPLLSMRMDEDYSYLANDSLRHDFYTHLKFVPLSANRSAYLSFGGEARLQRGFFRNEDWGSVGLGANDFLLQRYDLHADLHVGKHFRVFAQVRSALEDGRKDGPRPIDEDQLNVQNAFADVVVGTAERGTLLVRVGRQELFYGSQRLIDVREGPNLRLSFDGARASWKKRAWQVDGFLFSQINVRTGRWDNKDPLEPNLWGVYAVRSNAQNNRGVDLYYLGYARDAGLFEEPPQRERRQSFGVRWWRMGAGFDYDFEGVYQFGKYGSGPISAWTLSSSIGWQGTSSIQPFLGLKTDVISGDNNFGDGKLQTFNPLYPKGGYFGFDPQIGPVNLFDIHPYFSCQLTEKFSMEADVIFNWRYSLEDGVYRPSGAIARNGHGVPQRYVGTAYLFRALYQFNRFFDIDGGIQIFDTGPFLNAIGNNRNASLANVRTVFKF